MATVVREIERKYDAASGGTAVVGGVKTMTGTAGVAAVSELPEQLLDAIYYDTADLRLIGAGITLRRRTGGEDAGWHLKLPAGADTRDEIRLPLTSTDGAVPEELAALVRAYTRGVALAPTASGESLESTCKAAGITYTAGSTWPTVCVARGSLS